VYRELEIQAERERKTPADVLMERAEAGRSVPVVEPGPLKSGRISFPIIHSDNPGSFDPGEGGIYDYIDFP
ncbi:MAG: hypothetical protein ABI147_13785, partial [Acidobacteriaceae bacterium]